MDEVTSEPSSVNFKTYKVNDLIEDDELVAKVVKIDYSYFNYKIIYTKPSCSKAAKELKELGYPIRVRWFSAAHGRFKYCENENVRLLYG